MTKQFRNKLTAWLCCVAMLISMVPGTALPAFAAEADGTNNVYDVVDDTKVDVVEPVEDSGEEGTEPVEDEPAPVEEETEPAEDESAHVEEGTEPVEEEPALVEEETEPAEEESVPVEEEVEPVEDERVAMFATGTSGRAVVDSGYCGGEGDGTNLTWTLYEDGELVISGTGAMANFGWDDIPWYDYSDSLTKVEIDDSVTTIGNYAFCICDLASVVIPNSVTAIGDYAFYSCDLTSLELPVGVITIGFCAFYSCYNLTSVKIPDSVTTIGEGAFAECPNLAVIIVGEGNSDYRDVDGVLFSKDMTVLIQYPCGRRGAYTVPNGVTTIGFGAFSECYNLTSVVIPDSVTTIDGYAFYDCDGLTNVVISDDVTAIGSNAFADCGSLSWVEFMGDAPTDVGEGIFGRSNNATVYYHEGTVGWTEGELYDAEAGTWCGRSLVMIAAEPEPEPEPVVAALPTSGQVASGEYVLEGDLTLTGWLYIRDEVVIDLAGHTITAAEGSHAFLLDKEASNLTIMDSVGGGKVVSGASTGNPAIFLQGAGAQFTLDGGEITGWNRTGGVGGMIYLMDGTTFTMNDGKLTGASGYYASLIRTAAGESTITINGGEISGNSVTGNAPIGLASGVTMNITDGVFTGNSAGGYAGLIQVASGATLNISGGTFTENSAVTGGGVIYNEGTVSITGGTFTGNEVTGTASSNQGGVIMVLKGSTTTINGGTFTGNSSKRGGAIGTGENVVTENLPVLTIGGDVVIEDNICTEYGGNLYLYTPVLTINGGTIGTAFKGEEVVGKSAPANIWVRGRGATDALTTVTITGGDINGLAVSNAATTISGNPVIGEINATITMSGLTSGAKIRTADTGMVTIAEGDETVYTENDCDFIYNEPEREITASGYCGGEGDGTNLTWTLYEDGELVISGTGAMAYYDGGSAPWYSNQSAITTVTIGDGVTTIGGYAFYGCTSLISVEIPDGVTTIGKAAFYSCEDLTDVTLPDGVTTVGDGAFMYCSGLTTMRIPDGVTVVQDRVFHGCTGLTTVTIPNSVVAIYKEGFYGCSSLTEILIPDSVTTISWAAFARCDNLTRVEVLGNAPTCDEDAFVYCYNATTYYHEGTTGWPTTGTWCGRPLVMIPAEPEYTYTVTVDDALQGSVSVSAAGGELGDTITITVTPDEGYHVRSILVDDVVIEGTTFTITGDHEIDVTFAIDPGTYILSEDWILDGVIYVDGDVTVDLNGHTITAAEGEDIPYFSVESGHLTLNDSVGGGKLQGITTTLGHPMVMVRGKFTLNGGTLTGWSRSGAGGTVFLYDGAEFTMNGGAITGNSAISASAIRASDGGSTVTINGGEITDNNTTQGSAVQIGKSGKQSMLTINGGKIANNVYNWGEYPFSISEVLCTDTVVNINGGEIGTLQAVLGSLTALESSQINISGNPVITGIRGDNAAKTSSSIGNLTAGASITTTYGWAFDTDNTVGVTAYDNSGISGYANDRGYVYNCYSRNVVALPTSGVLTASDYELSADQTLTGVLTVSSGDVTVDLGGNTLTTLASAAITVTGGKLTLTNGTVQGVASNATVALVTVEGGEFVLDGATLTGNKTASGATGRKPGGIYATGGTVTINDGTVSGTNGSSSFAKRTGHSLYAENATVNINGGTIGSGDYHVVLGANGKLNVSGDAVVDTVRVSTASATVAIKNLAEGASIKVSDITPTVDDSAVLENGVYVYQDPLAAKYDIIKVATESGSYAVTVGGEEVTEAAEGRTVTITATPDAGYELDTILVDGEAIEGNTFTMPAKAVTVEATFKEDPTEYTVSLGANTGSGEGAVTLNGGTAPVSATYASKTSVTIVATPAEGHVLEGIYVDGGLATTESTHTLLITQKNHVISANFKDPIFRNPLPTSGVLTASDYELSADQTLTGVLTVSSGDVTVDLGGNTLTTLANAAITVTGGKLTLTNGTVQGVASDATVALVTVEGGEFVLDGATLTGNKTKSTARLPGGINATGGTVTINDGTVSCTNGASSSLLKRNGHSLYAENATVNINGGTVGSGDYHVVLGENAELTLSGNPVVDTIRQSSVYGSSGMAVTIKDLAPGASIKISDITPVTDDSAVLDGGAYVYQAPAAKYAIYDNTIDADANGSVMVTVDGQEVTEAAEGEVVTITATANPGYVLDTVKVDDVTLDGNTFTMPAKAVTVKAIFKEDPTLYTVSLGANTGSGEGTVTLNGGTASVSATYASQTTVAIAATPAEGHVLEGIYVNGTRVTTESTYSLRIEQENCVVAASFTDPNAKDQLPATGGALAAGEYALNEGNLNLAAGVTISGEVTIDLRGATLTGTAAPYFTINAGGKLTIMDSKTGGTVKGIEAAKSMIVVNGGEFVLDGGLLTGHNLTATNIAGAVVHLGATGSTFTMNGGEISGNSTVYRGAAIGTIENSNTHTININGGTIGVNKSANGRGVNIYTYTNTAVHSTMTITGGTIELGEDNSGVVSGASSRENVWLRCMDVTISGDAKVAGLMLANAGGTTTAGTGTIGSLKPGAEVTNESNTDLTMSDDTVLKTGNVYTYNAKPHAITVNVNDTTMGKAEANVAEAKYGDEVTVTATPAEAKYVVKSITAVDANGNAIALNGEKFIMPDCAVTVTVTFAALTEDQSVVYLTQPTEGGIVEINVVAGEIYPADYPVRISVAPEVGYQISVAVDGELLELSDGQFNFRTEGGKGYNIVATAKKIDYTVSVAYSTENVEGGTATLSKTVANYGDTITVTPAEGYDLVSVLVNGEAVYGNRFTMPAADVTVTVVTKVHVLPEYEGLNGYTGGYLPEGKYKLVADVALTGVVNIRSEVVIDLNGHCIITAGGGIFCVYDDGRLTIKDSSEDQTGKLVSGANEGTPAINIQAGSFTLEGGTITGWSRPGGAGGAVFLAANTSFTMNGGKITGNTANDRAAIRADKGGHTITINGGEITGNTSNTGAAVRIIGGATDMQGVTYDPSTVIITGGIIGSNTVGEGRANVQFDDCDVAISGNPVIESIAFTGTGTATIGNLTEGAEVTTQAANKLTIKAGDRTAYTEDGKTYIYAPTYEVVVNNAAIENGEVTLSLKEDDAFNADIRLLAPAGKRVYFYTAADANYVMTNLDFVDASTGEVIEDVDFNGAEGWFIMPAQDVRLVAEFHPLSSEWAEIKVTTAHNGVLSVDKTGIVVAGVLVTGTVEPNTGYELSQVYVNGKAINVFGGEFCFVAEGGTSYKITAEFTRISYPITPVDSVDGRAKASVKTARMGDTFTIKADLDHVLVNAYVWYWDENGCQVELVAYSGYTYIMPAAEVFFGVEVEVAPEVPNGGALPTSGTVAEGVYTLTSKHTLTNTLIINGRVVIDLAGRTIQMDSGRDFTAFNVYGGRLTICDSVGGGKVVFKNTEVGQPGIMVDGGEFILEGGVLTGWSRRDVDGVYGAGGMVYLFDYAKFTMTGGKITGANASHASAIRAQSNGVVVKLLGGEITGNNATSGTVISVGRSYSPEERSVLVIGGDMVIRDNTISGEPYTYAHYEIEGANTDITIEGAPTIGVIAPGVGSTMTISGAPKINALRAALSSDGSLKEATSITLGELTEGALIITGGGLDLSKVTYVPADVAAGYWNNQAELGTQYQGYIYLPKIVVEQGTALSEVALPGDLTWADDAETTFEQLGEAIYPVVVNGTTADLTVLVIEDLDKEYTVTVVPTEHGTITVTPEGGTAGTRVTIAVFPEEGYTLNALTVDGELNYNGSFLITGDHVVSGIFMKKAGFESETTVVLDEDSTVGEGIYLTNGNYVLDLNGKMLTGTRAPFITVANGAKLTIMDSSAEQTGKIVGITANGSMIEIESSGELVLESGTLTGHTNTAGDYDDGGVIRNAGTFTMTGGVITENSGAYAGAILVWAESVTNISGGMICNNTARRGGAISTGDRVWSDRAYYPVVNISGGTFTGNDVSEYGGALYFFTTELTITGGEFIGNTAGYNYNAFLRRSITAISGGTFDDVAVNSTNGYTSELAISGNPVIRQLNTGGYPTTIGELTEGAAVCVVNGGSLTVLDDTVAVSGTVYYYAGEGKVPCGDGVYWDLTDGVLTISGSGAMWDFASSNGAPWYDVRSTITTIIVEDGVTAVGDYAFYNCNLLTSVTIPDSVTVIGAKAFYVCSRLTEVVIPATVVEIGEGAFIGSSNLIITVAPENPNYCTVDGVLFTKDMTRLMTYPGGLTATSYTIPDSVTGIDTYAFFNALKLQEVAIPASVSTLGEDIFYNCSLKRINLAEGNTAFTMLDGAVYTADMKRLVAYEAGSSRTVLHIPEGVETIDKGALRNAEFLTSLCLPASVAAANVQLDLFNMSSLRSMVIGGSMTRISANNCSNLTDVYYLGDEASWETLLRWSTSTNNGLQNAAVHYVTWDQLRTLTAEDGVALSAHCAPVGAEVTAEGRPAFGYRVDTFLVDGEAIEGDTFTVTKDHTVSAIFSPYKDVETVASGTCGENLVWTLYADGELLIGGTGQMYTYNTSEATWAPWYAYREQITKVTIQPGVTSIGGVAFYNCTNLIEIVIPATITSLGSFAYGCTALTTIMVDEGNRIFRVIDGVLFARSNTASEVWDRLVRYPAGLPNTSYTIPNNVTVVLSSAFAYAANLQRITLSSNLQQIYGSTFYGCTGLTEITIPDSVTTIGGGAFNGCTGLTEITIPDSVTAIDSYAFAMCSGLAKVVIGDGVTTIGDYAFNGCNVLSDVTLGNAVKNIGVQAFGNNAALTEIVIPASVESISGRAFCYDQNLTTITVEQGNEHYCVVDGVLFTKDMTTLVTYPAGKAATEYVIPDSVTTVLGGAFALAFNLERITIPAGVSAIDGTVFYGCPLKAIDLATENTAFTKVDGALYTADMKTLVAYPVACGETTFCVPEGVETIRGGAVGHNSHLFAVCLPDSMTTIGAEVFRHAVNLRSIVIGTGVTNIYTSAFHDCPKLTDVYYVGDEASWNAIQFYNDFNQNLTSANIHYISRDELRTMSVANCENGSVALSAHCAPVGAEVTVFYTADEDYKLNQILVDGEPIEGTTFTVTGDHVVTVTFTVALPTEGEITEGTYVLKMDHALTGAWVVRGEVVLDLNGKTLSGVEAPYFTIGAGAKLTIMDSVGGGKVQGISAGTTGSMIEISGGEFVLESGTLTGNYCTRNRPGAIYATGGTVTITGGAITGNTTRSSYASAYGHSIYVKNAVINISGGIVGDGQNHVKMAGDGVMNVTGCPIVNAVNATSSNRIVLSELTEGASVKVGGSAVVTMDDTVQVVTSGSISEYSYVSRIVDFGTCGGEGDGSNLTWTLYRNGELVIEGTGEMGSFDYDSGMCDGNFVKTVRIGEGVTTIGDYAFSGFANLSMVELPDSVTYIGEGAFICCTALTDVRFGRNVDGIGSLAFFGCESLACVELPDSLAFIGERAFACCYALTQVTFGERLEYIGVQAFGGCSSLEEVVIPASVFEIGEDAFSNCAALTSVEFLGDAPDCYGDLFRGSDAVTVYCYAGTNGWPEDETWQGRPLVMFSTAIEVVKEQFEPEAVMLGGNEFVAVEEFAMQIKQGVVSGTTHTTVIYKNGVAISEIDDLWMEKAGIILVDGITCSLKPQLAVVGSKLYMTFNVKQYTNDGEVINGGVYFTTSTDGVTWSKAVKVSDAPMAYGLTGLSDKSTLLLSVADPTTKVLTLTTAGAVTNTVELDESVPEVAFAEVDGTVWALTSNGAVYFSTSKGATWTATGISGGNMASPDMVALAKKGVYITWADEANCKIYGKVWSIDKDDTDTYGWNNTEGNLIAEYYAGKSSAGRPATMITSTSAGVKTKTVFVDGGKLDSFNHGVVTSFGKNLALESSLTINFKTSKAQVADMGGTTVRFLRTYSDGRADVVTNFALTDEYTDAGNANNYSIPYAGIAAKEMGDNVYFAIYDANGNQVTTLEKYSVLAYANSQLGSSNAEFVTLLVDMLNYGAAAQTYFNYNVENLVNANLTDAQKACASADLVVDESMKDGYVNSRSPSAKNLALESAVEITLKYTYKSGNYQAQVKNAAYASVDYTTWNGTAVAKDHIELIAGTAGGGSWDVKLDFLATADVRSLVNIRLHNADGSVIEGTEMVYNIATYVYTQMRNGYDESDALRVLLMRLMQYGDAAYAYKT